MRFPKRFWALAACACLLAGCASNPPASAEPGAKVSENKPVQRFLVVYSGGPPNEQIKLFGKQSDGIQGIDEDEVGLLERDKTTGADGELSAIERCTGKLPRVDTGKDKGALILGVPDAAVGWVLSKVAGALVEKLDAGLQADVAKFSHKQTFPSRTMDFYRPFTGNPSLFDSSSLRAARSQRWFCFRLTRIEPNPLVLGYPPQITMDFVGKVVFDPEHHPRQLRVEPVRLYYRNLTSQNAAENDVTVKVALLADVLSLSPTGVTMSKEVGPGVFFSHVVHTGDAKAHPLYRVYPAPPLCSLIQADKQGCAEGAKADASDVAFGLFPLPPFDYSEQLSGREFNTASLAVTVTEVSKVPWLTQQLSTLVHDNKDDLKKGLGSAVNDAAGVSSK